MEQDLLLAKKLSKQLDREEIQEKKTKLPNDTSKTVVNSVVDPQWEIFDPNPDIYSLFQAFSNKFFWSELGSVEVKWSPRMYSCAGICTYKGRQGCVISLSLPLLKLRPRKDLVETLLHEMIHAYLFVTDKNSEREEHGPKFHSHMYRINKAAGTHITVYHTFHDEVKHYKTHWWRCNGSCKFKHPFYGLVKRSMNRAPGPNDFWFAEHQVTCGGEFIKVKEPEGFKARKSKTAKTNIDKNQTLDKYVSVNSLSKLLNSKSSVGVKNSTKIEPLNNVKPSIEKPGNNSSGFKNYPSKTGEQNTGDNSRPPINWFSSFGGGLMSNKGGTLVERPRAISTSTATSASSSETAPKSLGTNRITGFKSINGVAGLEKSNTLASTSLKTKPSFHVSNFKPFSGSGQVLDPTCKSNEINRANSRLLKLYSNDMKKHTLENNEDSNPTKKPKIEDNAGPSSLSVNNENTNSISVNCPVCNKELCQEQVNEHLDECMNLDSVMENVSEYVESKEDKNQECNAEKDVDSEALINCPVCNKECVQEKMDEHLNSCINLDLDIENNTAEVVVIDDENVTTDVRCPICDQKCDLQNINQHVDQCLQVIN